MKLMNILFAIFAIAISMVSLYLLTLLPVGTVIMDLTSPILEFIAPVVPGEVFPYFFNWEIFQRALVVSVLASIVAGSLGTFLLIRNLSLIGDGLAHVSFGAVAIATVIGFVAPIQLFVR